MQKLVNMLHGFSIPSYTRDEWDAINAEVARMDEAERMAERERRLRGAGIPRCFDGADLSKCDQAVIEWAENPGAKGLLLQGDAGRGKTYAACAALIALSNERTCRFVTMDDVIRQVKATFANQETEQAVIDRYVNVGVLCIDDVGQERLTEWSLPVFFSIIDKRHKANKPTIITTNYSGRALLDKFTVNGDAKTAQAVASRLSQYERVVFKGRDLRLS